MSENKPLENDVIIRLEHLSKSFSGKKVLDDINLDIRRGEFVTFLGPSGCGKTTTLRTIAGFNAADEGRVIMDGEDISALPPHLRPLNTVFQRYALFPHLDVYDNIAFGLKLKGVDSEEIDRRVRKMLKLVSMTDYEDRDVESLSGGQQQRVAIARALVNYPKVLLLDEPLAALDLKMRKDMQIELKEMHRKLGITFIYVTHDQEEALTLSDRIVVMSEGRIQQIGTPMDIYIMNKLEGAQFTAVVKSCTFKGVHYEMFVDTDSHNELMIQDYNAFEVGSTVGLIIRPEDIQVMKKERVENTFAGELVDSTHVSILGEEFECAPVSGIDEGTEVEARVAFDRIDLLDHAEDGVTGGTVYMILYKGDHYHLTIRTDSDEFVYVDTNDVWDKGDIVGINILPQDLIVTARNGKEE